MGLDNKITPSDTTQSGVFAAVDLVWSTTKNVHDKHPERVQGGWSTLRDSLQAAALSPKQIPPPAGWGALPFDERVAWLNEAKLAYPLFSPVEFQGGTKAEDVVEATPRRVAVFDLDGISKDAWDRVRTNLEMRGVGWFAYTTVKHGLYYAKEEVYRLRVCVRLGEDWSHAEYQRFGFAALARCFGMTEGLDLKMAERQQRSFLPLCLTGETVEWWQGEGAEGFVLPERARQEAVAAANPSAPGSDNLNAVPAEPMAQLVMDAIEAAGLRAGRVETGEYGRVVTIGQDCPFCAAAAKKDSSKTLGADKCHVGLSFGTWMSLTASCPGKRLPFKDWAHELLSPDDAARLTRAWVVITQSEPSRQEYMRGDNPQFLAREFGEVHPEHTFVPDRKDGGVSYSFERCWRVGGGEAERALYEYVERRAGEEIEALRLRQKAADTLYAWASMLDDAGPHDASSVAYQAVWDNLPSYVDDGATEGFATYKRTWLQAGDAGVLWGACRAALGGKTPGASGPLVRGYGKLWFNRLAAALGQQDGHFDLPADNSPLYDKVMPEQLELLAKHPGRTPERIAELFDAWFEALTRHKASAVVEQLCDKEAKSGESDWAHKAMGAFYELEQSMAGWPRVARYTKYLHGSLSEVYKRWTKLYPTREEDFDQHPELFNCANGTLELGEDGAVVFREHRQEDKLTQLSGTVYDPEARCPEWDRFVEWFTCGDVSMARYLAYVAAQGLWGGNPEQKMFFLDGKGNNGKTTWSDAVRNVLGGYGAGGSAELILAGRTGEDRFSVAQLEGARFFTLSDAPPDSTFDTGKIKAWLTDVITFERKGKDPVAGRVLATIVIPASGGIKPGGQSVGDVGVQRRLRVIRGEATVTKPDRSLGQKLQAEASGILNWILAGYRDWRVNGEPVCAAVEEATQRYFQGHDWREAFVEECLERLPDDAPKGASVTREDAFEAYRRWRMKCGGFVVELTEFESKLAAYEPLWGENDPKDQPQGRGGFPRVTVRTDGRDRKVRCLPGWKLSTVARGTPVFPA